HLFRRDLLAIGAAIAPRAELVPELDLAEGAFLRIRELYRVGPMRPEERARGGLHGNGGRGRHGARNGAAGRVDSGDNSAASAPLPVFAIPLLLLGYLRLLHHHERERRNRAVFPGPAAYQHAVAYLDFREGDGRGGLQVRLPRSQAQNSRTLERRNGHIRAAVGFQNQRLSADRFDRANASYPSSRVAALLSFRRLWAILRLHSAGNEQTRRQH